MAICKLCDPMKVFKILSPTHLKHAHDTTLAEYPALVEGIVVPEEIQAEEDAMLAEKAAAKEEKNEEPSAPQTAAEVWLAEIQARREANG